MFSPGRCATTGCGGRPSVWPASADAPGALFLRFRRVDLPGVEILEMIQMAPEPGIRMRSWQWLEDGVPVRRTLVQERRVSNHVP